MAFESSQTTERLAGPPVQQFAIFLNNKVGALLDVVKVMKEHAVDVLALNVQESADAAIVRLVVSDPEKVRDFFTAQGIPYFTADLVVAELKGASELSRLLTSLLMAEVNIHGCYSLLSRPHGNTSLALHVEDNECATAVLRSHNFRLLDQTDISR